MVLNLSGAWAGLSFAQSRRGLASSILRILRRIAGACVFPALLVNGAFAQFPGDIPTAITIRGVVLSLSDNKPIPGASVEVFEWHRTVTTDDQGRFELTGVPLGKNHQITARKDGFLCGTLHSRPSPHCIQSVDQAMENQLQKSSNEAEMLTTLKAGVADVTLTLLPAAQVSGRLVDQTGKPIADMDVTLSYRAITGGRYAWNDDRRVSARTDAGGDYQIKNIEPGTWLLHTITTTDPRVPFSHSDHGYAATWYPGTPAEASAQPLVIAPGQKVTANLTLKNEPFQKVIIPIDWTHLTSWGGAGSSLTDDGVEDSLDPEWDGNRHLYTLYAPQGTYTLRFTISPPNDPKTGQLQPWGDGTRNSFYGSAEFTVKDAPLALPPVPVQQPIDIPLTVQAILTHQEEHRQTQMKTLGMATPPLIYFSLNDDPTLRLTWSAVNPRPDFAFKSEPLIFKAVPPGRYVVKASAINDSWIASLTCGDVNLLREPLLVGPGHPPCTIQAVVRDDLASVSVALSADALARWTAAGIHNSDLGFVPLDDTEAPPASTFLRADPITIHMPPGRWIAFVYDGRSIAWRDPDFRKRLMRAGRIVILVPGGNAPITLDWSPELNDPHESASSVGLGRAILP